MADITWRQMAGPNFAGTAAAMDAGADRIGAATDLFSRAVGDQVKLQQQQQAKLRADNTARALAELSGFKTVDELNAAAPRLSFDALVAQHGKGNIDAGVVAQQAALQKGIIEQNQLRSVDLANKTREAQESPILGKAKEEISSLITQGKFDQATALANQYAPQITDASGLFGLVDQGRAAFTERQLASDRNARENTRAAQDTTLFKQQVDMYNKDVNEDKVIGQQLTENLAGKRDGFVVDFTKSNDPLKTATRLRQAQAEVIAATDLDPQVKNNLVTVSNIHELELQKAKELQDFTIKKNRETKPVANPAIQSFYDGLAPTEKAALDSVTTPQGVIKMSLDKAGVVAGWGYDTYADEFESELQDKLGKTKIEDVDPKVMAAAMQGLVNNDGALSDSAPGIVAQRIKSYSEKSEDYKNNKKAEDAELLLQKNQQRDLAKLYAEKEKLMFKDAKTSKTLNVNNLYRNLLGEQSKDPDRVELENKLGEVESKIWQLRNEMKLPNTVDK